MNDVNEDLVDQIVSRYDTEQKAKISEKKYFKELIRLKQATEALETLKLYEKQ